MQLQEEIATYRVLFKNKEKKPIPVTAERAAKIMDKLSKREFCAIRDMDGTVHGEQWTNIESVDPIIHPKREKREEEEELTPEQIKKRKETAEKVRKQVEKLYKKMSMPQ